MSTADDQARLEHVACLRDKELFRMLLLFEEVRETCAIIWPGALLDELSLDDIQGMLRAELDRRTAAKGAP